MSSPLQIIAVIVIIAGIAAALYNSDYNPLKNGWFDSEPKQEEQKPAAKSPAPSSTTATPAPSPKPAAVNQQGFTSSLQVAIRGFSFVSQEVRVKAGTKIVWINDDAAGHTVTSDTNLFSSKLLSQGKSFEYVFTKPGEYPYHCAIHPSMTGKVIVDP